jgi:hypothetical protein
MGGVKNKKIEREVKKRYRRKRENNIKGEGGRERVK